jgi:hypothetical protein
MDQSFKKLTANVPEDVVRRIDALVARHRPFATRHAVHVVALRLGLAELLANPERMSGDVSDDHT